MSHVYLHIAIPEDSEISVIVHRMPESAPHGSIYTRSSANAELRGWHTRFPLDPREDD